MQDDEEVRSQIVALMHDAADGDPEMVEVKCKRVKSPDMWVAGWQWTNPLRYGRVEFLTDPVSEPYDRKFLRQIYSHLKEKSIVNKQRSVSCGS